MMKWCVFGKLVSCQRISLSIGFFLLGSLAYADTDKVVIDKEKEFQKWVAAKMMCQNYPYFDEYDKKLAGSIRAAGMDARVRRSKQGIDGLVTPKKDKQILFFDTPVIQVSFQTQPQKNFLVRLQAEPDKVAAALYERMLGRYEQPGKDKYTDDQILYAFPTSRPTSYAPFGQEGFAVIIRKTDQEGVIDVGCQKF